MLLSFLYDQFHIHLFIIHRFICYVDVVIVHALKSIMAPICYASVSRITAKFQRGVNFLRDFIFSTCDVFKTVSPISVTTDFICSSTTINFKVAETSLLLGLKFDWSSLFKDCCQAYQSCDFHFSFIFDYDLKQSSPFISISARDRIVFRSQKQIE